jgi:hypothetical protein
VPAWDLKHGHDPGPRSHSNSGPTIFGVGLPTPPPCYGEAVSWDDALHFAIPAVGPVERRKPVGTLRRREGSIKRSHGSIGRDWADELELDVDAGFDVLD